MANILYITYDGILEPLGQSQVLAYLERLALDNHIMLVSFEKKTDRRDAIFMNEMRVRLRTANISWIALGYHKTPTVLATSFDIILGTLIGFYLTIRWKIHIVHCRSYVPAVMGLVIKRFTGVKFLFDMRGFWADERIDGGLWSNQSNLYKLAKWFETRFLMSADHVVTLTNASLLTLLGPDYRKRSLLSISTITTCTDLDRFRASNTIKRSDAFTLGYVGSIGTWYLFDEMLAVFNALLARRSDARLLIVNRREHLEVKAAVARAGIDFSRLELVAVEYADMPAWINRMDAGLMLIKPCFSKLASAPTKLAEYLGCGVPCLGNAGVGDVAEILEDNRVGVVLRNFNDSEIEGIVDRILLLSADPQTAQRCRLTAERLFSIEEGAKKYSQIYTSIFSTP